MRLRSLKGYVLLAAVCAVVLNAQAARAAEHGDGLHTGSNLYTSSNGTCLKVNAGIQPCWTSTTTR